MIHECLLTTKRHNLNMFRTIKLFFCTVLTLYEINSGGCDVQGVRINKCCEAYEVLVGKDCTRVSETNETVWRPMFTENGRANFQVNYTLVTGAPDCGSTQQWPIYHYSNSTDMLHLLPNGDLRHHLYRNIPGIDNGLSVEKINGKMSYDYPPGKYCMDKRIEGSLVSEFALVCGPEHKTDWTSTEFLMHNIVNPITHGISMICLLIVAIIYFVMPTLKDLVGNIVTTMSVCLIVSQAGDMARLLTVFTGHTSLIIAETFCYVSLLGAFFWLNSLAYYIWKTFRSRNVFLRITDGKKYCYYSAYAWSCTLILGFLAVFAHYTMDYPTTKSHFKFEHEQESIGSLGIIIFFKPIALTVLINIFFFVTTLKAINRMTTYGRIHHKLRHSFRMFILLFLIMTLTWIFFLMSFSKFEGLIHCHIVVNALQGPLFFYACIINQKHVSYLLNKTCCNTNCMCPCCQPEPECEWGDEMTAMNTGHITTEIY